MGFWLAAMQGLTDYRKGEADRNYQEQLDRQAGEEKIALTLLESDDPDVQQAGLQILTASLESPKKKKGVRGSMGEYERGQGLRPILDLANAFRGLSGDLPQGPPMAGSAGLPPASPVEPKAQGPGAMQPPMSGGFASRTMPPPVPNPEPGAAAMQVPHPNPEPNASPMAAAAGAGTEDWSAMLPDLPFAGVPMSAPQQAALDLATTPSGQLNMGAIAGRVSRDRGVPQPGERQRLFWPTKASIERNVATARAEGNLTGKARVFQQLGATPQQILSTMMAGEGNPMGAASTSGEIELQLPTGEKILAYHYRDPRTGQAFLAYTGPTGQPTPVPPGAQPYRLPSAAAAAGGSLTSYMTGQQMLEAGLVTPEDSYDPQQLYKVNQRGDNLIILPYAPPGGPPAQYTGAGVDPATGLPFERDRAGNTRPVPGMSVPTLNPRISAAKALLTAIREQERMAGLGTDEATIKQLVERAVQSGRYPALAGMTYEQIVQLEKLPPDTTDQMLGPILQAPPRLAPPPAAPPAPMAVPPPPSAQAAPPSGASAAPASSAPPAGWAQGMVEEILKGRRARPQPGTVQGRPPK